MACTRFAKQLPCPLEASTFVNNSLKFRSNHIFLNILIIPLSDPVFLSYSCGVQKTSTFIDLFFTRTGIFGHFLVYCPSFCNVVILQTATKKGILHAATLALYSELSV